MNTPNRETIEALRKKYPVGCMVELIRMDDPFSPPVGTRGIVIGVDDMGTIHVNWSNGSSLGIAFGEDDCRRICDE